MDSLLRMLQLRSRVMIGVGEKVASLNASARVGESKFSWIEKTWMKIKLTQLTTVSMKQSLNAIVM